mmetsp:Transcript_32465/g.73357  ORF Transcript_32465/g.73357 Transcript_32465/m.73357 type:complete len:152 (+) Transcript_32465:233-688(+)
MRSSSPGMGGDDREAVVRAALEQAGLSTAGVLDQISLGLNAAKRLTKDLEVALDPRVLAAPKSTLTDKAALELYTSFFQDEALLSDESMDFALRVPPPPPQRTSAADSFAPRFDPKLGKATNWQAAWPTSGHEGGRRATRRRGGREPCGAS